MGGPNFNFAPISAKFRVFSLNFAFSTNIFRRRENFPTIVDNFKQFFKQSCSAITSEALEVNINVTRFINPRFTYLLTYLLTSLLRRYCCLSVCLLPMYFDE